MTDEIKKTPVETTIPQVDNAIPGVEYDISDDIPYVFEEPGHIRFTWRTHCIEIEARHFNNTRCHAEIEVWFEDTGHRRLLLPVTHVDLKSAQSRWAVSSQLEKVNELFVLNWDWFIDCVAFKIIALSRQQEPIKEIASNPDITLVPDYVLKPLLYRGHPTVIFGDKNTCKSLTALVASFIVQLPYPENKLGLIPGDDKTCFCLYLDYEDEEATFTKRWTAIQRGFNVAEELDMTIFYKRMASSLADSVETLRNEIIDRHIGLLIVDSLAPAAGGNLNDPEPAIEYHQALRALGVTSLTLAHNSKDPLTKRKSIFGSVFFTNLARSIWQAERDAERIPDEATISLTQVNANLSELHPPFGYRYYFDNVANTIIIEQLTQAEMYETSLRHNLSTSAQIKNEWQSGAKTIKELSDTLGIPEPSIRTNVYRLATKDGIAIKTGKNQEGIDIWGLKAQEDA